MFFQAIGDRRAQFLRKDGGRLFFPAFLAQIDDADERHLLLVHALGQVARVYTCRRRVVITLQRRRGGAENDDAFLHLRAHDRDVARVITRRFLLLVGGLVFFIDDDQSEVFERRENRAARADHDAGPAGMDLVPFVVPFAFGQDGCAGPRRRPALRRSGP